MKVNVKALTSSPAVLLGLAALAYLLIRKLIPEKTFGAADTAVSKLVGTVTQGYSDAATAAQKALQSVSSGGAIKVNARIILPGAQSIDPASVKITFDANNTPTFAYAGNRYQLMPRNSEGNYPAKVL